MKRHRRPKSALFINTIGLSFALVVGLVTYLVTAYLPESAAASSRPTGLLPPGASLTANGLDDPEALRGTRQQVAAGVVPPHRENAPVGHAEEPQTAARSPTARQAPEARLPGQEARRVGKPPVKRAEVPVPAPDPPEPIELQETEPFFESPDLDNIVFEIPDPPPIVAPEGPIHVGGDVQKPYKVSAPQPQYTEEARKARIQGVVIVQAIIDKTGSVAKVKILKGLPMGLSEKAVESIKSWQFEPATLHGKPVDVYYNLTVNFRLQ